MALASLLATEVRATRVEPPVPNLLGQWRARVDASLADAVGELVKPTRGFMLVTAGLREELATVHKNKPVFVATYITTFIDPLLQDGYVDRVLFTLRRDMVARLVKSIKKCADPASLFTIVVDKFKDDLMVVDAVCHALVKMLKFYAVEDDREYGVHLQVMLDFARKFTPEDAARFVIAAFLTNMQAVYSMNVDARFHNVPMADIVAAAQPFYAALTTPVLTCEQRIEQLLLGIATSAEPAKAAREALNAMLQIRKICTNNVEYSQIDAVYLLIAQYIPTIKYDILDESCYSEIVESLWYPVQNAMINDTYLALLNTCIKKCLKSGFIVKLAQQVTLNVGRRRMDPEILAKLPQ